MLCNIMDTHLSMTFLWTEHPSAHTHTSSLAHVCKIILEKHADAAGHIPHSKGFCILLNLDFLIVCVNQHIWCKSVLGVFANVPAAWHLTR